jgi:N-acetylmuramoyl-L-alanine amidase CwlA
MVRPPNPRYLGPAFRTSAGANKPPTRVVIHSTVSPCKPGGAEQIAAYFRSPAAGGSAHYVVDPDEVVQVVFDSVIAWHAPPNAHSIGIEMCDIPGPVPNDPPTGVKVKR